MKKGISTIFAFLLGAFFIIVVGGAFYAGTKLQKSNSETITNPIKQITPVVKNESTITPTIDETETIIEAMRKAIVAKRGGSASELNFSVSKIMGNYAQGGISAQGGGAMWFGAKVNGKWTLVWDGNGVILCSDIINYPDLPKVMVPECYNDKTNKTVVR